MVSCYHEPPFVVHVGLSEKLGSPNSNGLNLIFPIKERPTSQPLEMSEFLVSNPSSGIASHHNKTNSTVLSKHYDAPISLVMPNDSMSTYPDIR